MEWGVHLNKSCLDLMQNGGAKAVDFYYKRKKVRPLHIWSHRIVECHSNQSTPRLPWLLGLEWNKYRKDLSQPHQAFRCQACHGGQKLFLSIHFLCPAFLPHSLHSRQSCKVYMKGVSPLPSSNSVDCINCLPSGSPLPSPVCIFPTTFHADLRI